MEKKLNTGDLLNVVNYADFNNLRLQIGGFKQEWMDKLEQLEVAEHQIVSIIKQKYDEIKRLKESFVQTTITFDYNALEKNGFEAESETLIINFPVKVSFQKMIYDKSKGNRLLIEPICEGHELNNPLFGNGWKLENAFNQFSGYVDYLDREKMGYLGSNVFSIELGDTDVYVSTCVAYEGKDTISYSRNFMPEILAEKEKEVLDWERSIESIKEKYLNGTLDMTTVSKKVHGIDNVKAKITNPKHESFGKQVTIYLPFWFGGSCSKILVMIDKGGNQRLYDRVEEIYLEELEFDASIKPILL